MKTAVRIIFENFSNFGDRLDGSELAVHSANRHKDRIAAQQFTEMAKVDFSIPTNVQQVYFISLLLKIGERSAYGSVLKRGGDNVLSTVAGGACNTFISDRADFAVLPALWFEFGFPMKLCSVSTNREITAGSAGVLAE